MKKIGILTLPLIDNYGGILQAVALYSFLASKGYDVVSIRNDFFISRQLWKRLAVFFLERIPFQDLKGFRGCYIKKKIHDEFINKFMPNRTRAIGCRHDLINLVRDYSFDSVIVGSDQVWRWDYIQDDYKRYFLDFVNADQTRKIAYAASFGKSTWQASEFNEEVSHLLRDFYAISVRETDALTICQALGRVDSKFVLDPTLLVRPEFYDSFIKRKKAKEERKRLLIYILDENDTKDTFVKQAKTILGYELVCLGLGADLSVPDWLESFSQASFIITDSFHGMVFSILFNKQFVVIGNPVRGLSRFESMLEIFNLKDRMIRDGDNIGNSLDYFINNIIDYQSVNEKLSILRNQSEFFLVSAIDC